MNKSSDQLSKKRQLFLVLRVVYEAFEQDQAGIEISLGNLLKDYEIRSHAYVALGIKALGLVKVEVQKGRKRCITWNSSARPNEQMADEILKLAQRFKSGKFIVVDPDMKPLEMSIGMPYDKKKLVSQDSSPPLKLEQLDAEITRLRHELRLAHDETTIQKGQAITALDRNNELISVISAKDNVITNLHKSIKDLRDCDVSEEYFKLLKTVKAYKRVLKDALK